MIQQESRLRWPTTRVPRRSCASRLGGSRRRYSVYSVTFNRHREVRHPGAAVRKGDVVKCVVVRTKNRVSRCSYIRFDENEAVLINDQQTARGT